jgi:CheY-like chemotaxis protein
MLVKHFLIEKLGVICEIAENGEEAIEMWKKQRYHLIIMDIQMPKMVSF